MNPKAINNPCWRNYACLVFLGLVVSQFAIAATGQDEAKQQLDVSFAVRNPTTKQVLNLGDETIRLDFRSTTFMKNDSLEKLLRANGVLPDIEALAVVYARNPEVNSDSFRPGVTMFLPAVNGGERLTSVVKDGYLVELTLEKQLKDSFVKNVQAASLSAAELDSLDVALFSDESNRTDFLGRVKRTVELFSNFREVIRNRTLPIGPELIRDLHGEAELLTSLIQRVVKKEVKPADVATQLTMLEDDLSVRAELFRETKGPGRRPNRNREMLVKVEAFSLADGKELKRVRVYYVPIALKDVADEVREFLELASPTQTVLPEANYFMWVGQPGDRQPQPHGIHVPVRQMTGVKEQKVQFAIP